MAGTELKRHQDYMNMPCSQGELEYVTHLGDEAISKMTDTEFARFDARRRKVKQWAKENNVKTW